MSLRPTVDFEKIINDSGILTTEEAIEAELKKEVERAGSNISNDSAMSPFWRLIKAVVIAPVLWLVNVLLATHVLPNMFAATAKGVYADLKAWEVGLERQLKGSMRGVVLFTKEDRDTAVNVPKGTVIETERVNDTIYRLIVIEDTLIPAGAMSGDVLADAENAGVAYNLSAGYYSILPQAVSGIVNAVTQSDYITRLGTEDETDDDLMLRTRNQFTAAGHYHIDAVYRSIIATVAGIRSDLIFFENTGHITPGSSTAFILMEVGETPTSLLDKLNNHIMGEGYHGHGDILTCRAIAETTHELSIEVFCDGRIDEAMKEIIKKGVEQRTRCAFRENAEFNSVDKTAPNTRFSLSRLGQQIHNDLNQDGLMSLKITADGQGNDIVSGLSIPRIQTLLVELANEH